MAQFEWIQLEAGEKEVAMRARTKRAANRGKVLSTLIAALAFSVMAVSFAAPALAEDKDQHERHEAHHDRDHRRDEHRGRGYYNPNEYYGSPPPGVYAPPPPPSPGIGFAVPGFGIGIGIN